MAEGPVQERVEPWERRFGCGFVESILAGELWGHWLAVEPIGVLCGVGRLRGGDLPLLLHASFLHAGADCWTENLDPAKSRHCSSAVKAESGVDHPWADQWVASLGRTECSVSSMLPPGMAMRNCRNAAGADHCVECAIGNVHKPKSGKHGCARTQWT